MNEIKRAEEAKRLLAEPMLLEAFEAIHSALMGRLMVADVGALETHRDLVVSLQLLAKLRRHLEQVVVTGELAKEELALNNAQSQRRKR